MKVTYLRRSMQHLALFAVLCATCVLLIACGSSNATSAESAASTVLPTAVPTTPPLYLPPADDSLPALAAITPSTAVPTTESPLTVGQPDANTETPIQAPAVGSDSGSAVEAEAVTISSVARWSECVVNAAGVTNAAALLDPIAAGSPTDMTSVQLNTLAAASVGCDVVTTNLAVTDLADHVATASTCLNAWLESSAGGSVFVGLTSIGWAQPTPAWAQAQLVDALDACFTGVSFAAEVMASVAPDASLTAAFNGTCLAASFDTAGTLRVFAQALATDPYSATLSVGLDDAWVLSCANVGQVVAAAAAADGVALSSGTIACIDSELKGAGMVAQLIAGTADSDAVGISTIACLTNAEAAALLG